MFVNVSTGNMIRDGDNNICVVHSRMYDFRWSTVFNNGLIICLMKSFEILYCVMPLCQTDAEILEDFNDAVFVLT